MNVEPIPCIGRGGGGHTLYAMLSLRSGLEKLTNANWSVRTVNDRLFPVKLTETADWTSVSHYMLHLNFGQTLTKVIGGNFGAYTFILPLSPFPKYLSTFLDVLSTERILKQNKNTSEFPRTNSYQFRQAHSSGSI